MGSVRFCAESMFSDLIQIFNHFSPKFPTVVKSWGSQEVKRFCAAHAAQFELRDQLECL